MNERNCNRSVTDGGCNPLDAPATHVSNRENPWHTGLEQVWRTGEGPVGRGQIFWGQIGTGLDEPLRVERNAVIEPVGIRHSAGHKEEVPDLVLLDLAGSTISPLNGVEVIVSFQGHDFCVRPQYDRGRRFDPAYQVTRHGLSQTGRPDDQMHALCCLCEKYGSLARGVSASNHDHFFSAAQLRLHIGSAVVDARSLEAGQVL